MSAFTSNALRISAGTVTFSGADNRTATFAGAGGSLAWMESGTIRSPFGGGALLVIPDEKETFPVDAVTGLDTVSLIYGPPAAWAGKTYILFAATVLETILAAWARSIGIIGGFEDPLRALFFDDRVNGRARWVFDAGTLKLYVGPSRNGGAETAGTLVFSVNMTTGATAFSAAALADPNLIAIAGLASAANKGMHFTGAGTAALHDLTAAGRALLDDADAAAQRVTLGAAASTDPTVTGTLAVLGSATTRMMIGYGTAVNLGALSAQTVNVQVHGTDAGTAQAAVYRWAASNGGATFSVVKSRGATPGARGLVQNNDIIGSFQFWGDDGTHFPPAAALQVQVDGTAAAGVMPGRIVFSTTPTAGGSVTERMRVDSTGLVSVVGSLTAGGTVRVGTYTIATLPSASAVGRGARAAISDGTSNRSSVESDGSIWRYFDGSAV